MKWYVFLDSTESSTVNLILDHNTTASVVWNEDYEGTTPDTVNAKLQEDVTNWNEADNGTDGYWTSNFTSSGDAWYVGCDGGLDNLVADYDSSNGVRPVITVSKSIFE